MLSFIVDVSVSRRISFGNKLADNVIGIMHVLYSQCRRRRYETRGLYLDVRV